MIQVTVSGFVRRFTGNRHVLKLIVRTPNAFGIAVGVSDMLIHTAEGKRSIDEKLVLCSSGFSTRSPETPYAKIQQKGRGAELEAPCGVVLLSRST
jgi:hypothetical protein